MTNLRHKLWKQLDPESQRMAKWNGMWWVAPESTTLEPRRAKVTIRSGGRPAADSRLTHRSFPVTIPLPEPSVSGASVEVWRPDAMTIKSRDLAPAATSANTASGANVSRWMRQGEDSGGYDPEKFYTKAHDYRGHGERVSVTLPPDVYAQVQQMVHEDQMVDYTMPADFVRDAIVHHLQMRKSQLGSPRLREAVEELIRSLTLAEMIKRDLEEAGRWHVMDEEIDGVMGIFERDRAFDQMAVRLGLYEEFMEHAAEPYRSKALAKVRQWTEKIPPEFAAD